MCWAAEIYGPWRTRRVTTQYGTNGILSGALALLP
jgi:hypothetical protein